MDGAPATARAPLPLYYSDEALSALQDGALVQLVQAERQRLTRRHGELRGQITSLLDGFASAQVATLGSYDAFLWAHTMVTSRTLTLRGRKYLAPFADMFNYAPVAAGRAAGAGAHFEEHHRVVAGPFEVYADRAREAGQQRFEDYGDNSNAIYLTAHGFVPEVNPFECVQVSVPRRMCLRARERVPQEARAALEARQKAWPTSLEADEAALRRPLGDDLRSAIQYRVGQKRLLRALLQGEAASRR